MSGNLEKIDINLKILCNHLHEKPITPALKASSDKIVSKINKSRRYQQFEKCSTILGIILLVIGILILFFSKEELRMALFYISRLLALLVITFTEYS
jgi:hypothetical protein